MHAQGAHLAFSYANDKFKERVEPLAASIGSKLLMPMDVQLDEQIDAAFALLAREWGQLDILVHAVAFAPREALAGSYTANTSREAFRIAHDVSSYSFTALARGAAALMAGRAGAMLTLSYLGGVRALPRRGPRSTQHPRQRHIGRPDQDAGRRGHRRLSQDAGARRASRAAAP